MATKSVRRWYPEHGNNDTQHRQQRPNNRATTLEDGSRHPTWQQVLHVVGVIATMTQTTGPTRYLLCRHLCASPPVLQEPLGVSKNSVSWNSTCVTMKSQENERRSDVTFLVQTFWAPPYGRVQKISVLEFDVCNDEVAKE